MVWGIMKNFRTALSYFLLLYLAACISPGTPVETPPTPGDEGSANPAPVSLAGLESIAANSSCAKVSWPGRGSAPVGYYKGMALTFAKSLCRYKQRELLALVMADKNTGNDSRDALSWYNSNFKSAGMDNSTESAATLRHLYTLALGLGMRESSGHYCEGRDMSSSNVTSDTAEAGLFQTSWNAASASSVLPKLFAQYQGEKGCFLAQFKEGASSCTSNNLSNYGSGDGKEFQRLSKACPAFATEFAMVVLRTRRNHYGPINRKEAQINSSCDSMLSQIEKAVNDNPNLCEGMN